MLGVVTTRSTTVQLPLGNVSLDLRSVSSANLHFLAVVVLPDLFNGDPVPLNRPPDFDLQKWLQSGHLPEQVEYVNSFSLLCKLLSMPGLIVARFDSNYHA